MNLYNHIMDNDVRDDQQELICIVGAMLDAVVMTQCKRAPPECEQEAQMLQSWKNLTCCEAGMQGYNYRGKKATVSQTTSVFDTYSNLMSRFKSDQARFYLQRYVDTILSTSGLEQQSSQQLMVRKSQLGELARTLMKDLGPGFSLIQAESVIRKSVLEHVQDAPAGKA